MNEYELEAVPAQEWEFEEEGEWEGEWEEELEGEYEAEAFFGRLAALARRAARSPALRRVGLSAARAALRGLGDVGGALAGPTGRRMGAMAGRALAAQLPQREWELEGEGEFEEEWEGEFEGEWEGEGEYEEEFEEEYEINPIRRIYPEALMEHLGHAAATARNEAEAEAFVGALVPLAARMAPRAAPAMARATPQLVRGLAAVTRTLRQNPQTRNLVRVLPAVTQRTAARIAQRAAQGQPVTPQAAVRTLAQQAARVIGDPRLASQVYRRSASLDRRYHWQQGQQRQGYRTPSYRPQGYRPSGYRPQNYQQLRIR